MAVSKERKAELVKEFGKDGKVTFQNSNMI